MWWLIKSNDDDNYKSETSSSNKENYETNNNDNNKSNSKTNYDITNDNIVSESRGRKLWNK